MVSTSNKVEYDELVYPFISSNKFIDISVKNKLEKLDKINFKQSSVKFIKLKLIAIRQVLHQTFNLIQISKISMEKLAIKNEPVLDKARKNLYFIIHSFEEIVGSDIDSPLSENKSSSKLFEGVLDNLEKGELFKQVGFLIDSLGFIYGDNSKWKWNFLNLKGRIIVVMKNSIDLRELISKLNPALPEYSKQMDLLNLILEKTESIAEDYRKKYELTDKTIDDMKNALSFISLRRQLSILLGHSEEVEIFKKKFNIWNKKLNEDINLKDKIKK